MRNWKSVAIASAISGAVACGGSDDKTTRAEIEEETIGGETVVTTEEIAPGVDDAYVTYSETDVYRTPPPTPGAGSEMESMEEPGIAYGERIGAESMPMEEPMDEEFEAWSYQAPGVEERTAEPEIIEEPLAQNAVCPADIEGLNVQVSTISRGGALVFTARGEEAVGDLRTRLNQFADMHRAQKERTDLEGMGETREAEAVPGSDQSFADANALIHRASEVRVVEIPRGARLEFRLEGSGQVADLRAELREDAAMLREGRCPLSLQLEST